MTERFASWVIRWRWLVIAATVLGVLITASGGSNIVFSANYRVFFAEGNEQLEAFETLQNTYTKSDNVIIVMTPQDGNVFSKPFLSAVHQVTENAWQLPYSTRVDSLTNYQHTEAEEDDLIVADLVDDPARLTSSRLAEIRNIVLNEPLVKKRLVSEDARISLVNVTAQMPQKAEDEVPHLVSAARELINQMEAAYPEIDFHLTGTVMLNNAFGEMAQKDMSQLMPIMMLIIIVTLGLMLRSISGTVATVTVIVMSIMTAMGIFGWLGWTLTPPAASAPTIIMTMAVADCVHILVTFLHGMRQGHSKADALKESIRLNLQPVFITSLTTALGFLSMNFSEVPPFQDLGNTVAMGVTAAFFLSILFLPALMMVLPVRVKVLPEKENQTMSRLSEFVIKRRHHLLWGTVALTVALVFVSSKNQINDEFIKYFDTNTSFRQDTDYLSNNMTGIYTIEYSLESPYAEGISHPDFLQDVAQFTGWLRTLPEVEHVYTLSDTFKRLNKNMNGDDESFYRLPDHNELAAQYLLLYEMSLPYGLDLNDQIDVAKQATRVVVTTKNFSSQETLVLELQIDQWLRNNTQIDTHYAASPNLMFSHIGKRNVSSMIGGTLLALFFISMILIAALRSFKLGLISLAPNLIPAGMAFGVWAIFNGNLGISLASAVGMTLGIVVDDTVHFLSKYQRARREQGKSTEEAVRYAFSTVGVALWVTTLVLVSGFLVLAASDFNMNAHMGMFTALTIGIALIIDFLFLPALLISVEETNEEANVLVSTTGQPVTD